MQKVEKQRKKRKTKKRKTRIEKRTKQRSHRDFIWWHAGGGKPLTRRTPIGHARNPLGVEEDSFPRCFHSNLEKKSDRETIKKKEKRNSINRQRVRRGKQKPPPRPPRRHWLCKEKKQDRTGKTDRQGQWAGDRQAGREEPSPFAKQIIACTKWVPVPAKAINQPLCSVRGSSHPLVPPGPLASKESFQAYQKICRGSNST